MVKYNYSSPIQSIEKQIAEILSSQINSTQMNISQVNSPQINPQVSQNVSQNISQNNDIKSEIKQNEVKQLQLPQEIHITKPINNEAKTVYDIKPQQLTISHEPTNNTQPNKINNNMDNNFNNDNIEYQKIINQQNKIKTIPPKQKTATPTPGTSGRLLFKAGKVKF